MRNEKIELQIAGIGIILYSPASASHISEGENYLESSYMTDDQVQRHIQSGSVVGFGTGSPGTFTIFIRDGYPPDDVFAENEFKLRLGVHVKGGILCFRDLFDLIDWTVECPPRQRAAFADGDYHITLCSRRPASGIVGDQQVILAYFNRLPAFPKLRNEGIPTLCTD